MIKVKKLNDKAIIPNRGSEGAAGLDLHSLHNVRIPSQCREVISTGIAMQLGVYNVGLIWPRSKLAVNEGITVLAGVVDNDYTGEIKVVLLNTSHHDVNIKAGDAIAQLIVQPYLASRLVEVDNLVNTLRSNKGIDSQDMRKQNHKESK